MIALGNTFQIMFEVAGKEVNIEPSLIQTFAISHSSEHLVPSIKIVMADSYGTLSHFLPSSKKERALKIALGYATMSLDEYISFDFDITRKFIDAGRNLVIEGVLSVNNLFAGEYCNAFVADEYTNVADTLSMYLQMVLGVKEVSISPSLQVYPQTFLMPCCTYADFLRNLPKELSKVSQGSGYYVIIQNTKHGSKLCINNYTDVLPREAEYKFFAGTSGFGEHLPVYAYTLFDNTGLKNIHSIDAKNYKYFDYMRGEFVSESIPIWAKESLTEFINVDVNTQQGASYPQYLGRNNDIDGEFLSKAQNNYSHELMDLMQMEIISMALPEIQIGALVDLKFSTAFENPSNMLLDQYQGYWLVKGFSHTIRDSEMYTSLTLVRSGVDTELKPEFSEPMMLGKQKHG